MYALEIKKRKYNKKINVLNRDEGNLVKTNTWTPLLAKLNKTQNICGGVLYLA